MFSNRLLQNCQRAVSNSNYSAIPDCQIAVAYLEIKEHQIAKSI
jgi:hypothetical protein